MADQLGGLDVGMPDEGSTKAPEQLSDEAKQRFAAAAAAMQQIRREEKKSKKRDDRVAQVIIQFLHDKKHAHLFTLIARLVARNCPSIFILAILSLVHEESRNTVKEYLAETHTKTADEAVDESMALMKGGSLDPEMNAILVKWITRMQMVLSVESLKILSKLMIDDRNIDGTVLQLSTFILQDYFGSRNKEVPFEKLQPLTANILQTVFEPFVGEFRKYLLKQAEEKAEAEKQKEKDDE